MARVVLAGHERALDLRGLILVALVSAWLAGSVLASFFLSIFFPGIFFAVTGMGAVGRSGHYATLYLAVAPG